MNTDGIKAAVVSILADDPTLLEALDANQRELDAMKTTVGAKTYANKLSMSDVKIGTLTCMVDTNVTHSAIDVTVKERMADPDVVEFWSESLSL